MAEATAERPVRCAEIDEAWQHYFTEVYDWGQPRSQPGNRASVLPHVCENFPLMYRRWWKEHVRPEARLLSVFRRGIAIEKDVRLLLEHEMGMELRRSGMSQDWPAYQISGSIDTEIKIGGEWMMAEIKSCHPNLYPQINSVADFAGMRFHVYRRYPGQLLVYQWVGAQERALMILANKNNSEVKGVWQYLDEHVDYAESLIQRAEKINRALADDTPNLQQISDPAICPECEFAARCGPPLTFAPPLISRNPAFISLLDQRGAVEAASKRFKELDEELKGALKRVEWGDSKALLAGGWIVDRRVNKNQRESFKIRGAEEPKEEGDG